MVDFKKARKDARKEINKWVEDQTNGRIKNFVNMKMLRPNTVLVAVAALYFHGDWKFPFTGKTLKKVFNINEKEKKRVPMMSMKDPIRTLLITWQELDARVLKLPYEGNRTSMIFILPEEKLNLKNTETKMQRFGIKNMLASLDTLSAASNFSEITKVKVQIPKFKMSKRLRLNSPLKKLGMENMFTPRADFTNMVKNKKTSKIKVSEVFQKINVIVNEKGSEVAAAGAAVTTQFKSASNTRKFVCDEPFLFVLRDDETGTVLLMGKVADPSKT